MGEKNDHTVETIIKILEIGKIDTPNTHMHDSSLSWFGTGTTIKGCRVK